MTAIAPIPAPEPPLPRVRFDDETGIYRDCTACHGIGLNGHGCYSCLTQRDADFAAFAVANPPVSFRFDQPDEMEELKRIMSHDALVKDGPGLPSTLAALTEYDVLMAEFREFQQGHHYKFLCGIKGSDYTFAEWKSGRMKAAQEAMAKLAAEQGRALRDAGRPRDRYVCQHCGKEHFVTATPLGERVRFPEKCCGKMPKWIEIVAPAEN